jgi:hypothetical protein
MKKYIWYNNIIFLYLLINIYCQETKDNQPSSCNNLEDSINKFILKTDLTQNEIEQILSKNFTLPININKKQSQQYLNNFNINENVKEFKSNDNSNKTILLLEINDNLTKLIGENKINNESFYELIDAENENDTKIFLSFDKFFTAKYKEMFAYSYTIIIFCVILAIIIIYYTFILPNEAPDWNINSPIPSNTSKKNRVNNIDNEYILKDNDI